MQFYMVVRLVNLISEFGALIYLRYSEPNAHRPFVVPGGYFGVWVITIPTILISAFALATSDQEVIQFGLGTLFMIVFGYYIKFVFQRSTQIWRPAADLDTNYTDDEERRTRHDDKQVHLYDEDTDD